MITLSTKPNEEPACLLGDRNANPTGIGFCALLWEDWRTHDHELFSQGFWALAVHRFGNKRMDIRPKLLRAPFKLCYRILYKLVEIVCGIHLPYSIEVGRRLRIWHFGGIVISARSIGDDCHLRQNTTIGVARRGAPRTSIPTLGDRVDVGAGAVIVGPIAIGDDVQIGANAVVLESVPAGATAVGIPARVIQRDRQR